MVCLPRRCCCCSTGICKKSTGKQERTAALNSPPVLLDFFRISRQAGKGQDIAGKNSIVVAIMSSSDSRTAASSNESKATSLASIVDSIPLHDGPAAPAPKPMTLPAILRQNVPGYKARTAQDRVRQLRKENEGKASSTSSGSSGSGSKSARMGKRKQRRWENGQCIGLVE